VSEVRFENVDKTYPNGYRAVSGLELEVADGEFLVLVGPSGCGKTTALRMVAGLESVSSGSITVGAEDVTRVPPQRRDVAMVFQNYALYPHMTVYNNLAFPLRCARRPRAEVAESVKRVAALMGLEQMVGQRPRTLSGGQRQRVAMGRALIRRPTVFLMDEPLSNLDAQLRSQMRAEITQLQRSLGITSLYVTHDQVEAMTMGDRIAVMRHGVLQQVGTPSELYREPANLFVASFMGSPPMNLVRARVTRESGELRCNIGSGALVVPGPLVRALEPYTGGEVALGIRPEDLGVVPIDGADAGEPQRSGRSLVGQVGLVEVLGAEHLVHVDIAGEPVLNDMTAEMAANGHVALPHAHQNGSGAPTVPFVAKLAGDSAPATGKAVHVTVAVERLCFFDLASGVRVR